MLQITGRKCLCTLNSGVNDPVSLHNPECVLLSCRYQHARVVHLSPLTQNDPELLLALPSPWRGRYRGARDAPTAAVELWHAVMTCWTQTRAVTRAGGLDTKRQSTHLMNSFGSRSAAVLERHAAFRHAAGVLVLPACALCVSAFGAPLHPAASCFLGRCRLESPCPASVYQGVSEIVCTPHRCTPHRLHTTV